MPWPLLLAGALGGTYGATEVVGAGQTEIDDPELDTTMSGAGGVPPPPFTEEEKKNIPPETQRFIIASGSRSSDEDWFNWHNREEIAAVKASEMNIHSGLQSQLEARAAGTAPSAAELQMQQGLERAQAGASSMALSSPGMSPGLAMRLAQRSRERQSLQVGQQTTQLRAQEQATGERALSSFMMQQQQLRNQKMQAYMQQGMTRQAAELQARTDLAQMQQQANIAEMQASQAQAAAKGELLGTITTAGLGTAGDTIDAVAGGG